MERLKQIIHPRPLLPSVYLSEYSRRDSFQKGLHLGILPYDTVVDLRGVIIQDQHQWGDIFVPKIFRRFSSDVFFHTRHPQNEVKNGVSGSLVDVLGKRTFYVGYYGLEYEKVISQEQTERAKDVIQDILVILVKKHTIDKLISVPQANLKPRVIEIYEELVEKQKEKGVRVKRKRNGQYTVTRR